MAMAEADPQLDELARELERAAARLRAGELDPDAAAALVDECARLAAHAASALDRHARTPGPLPGQDSLL
jgi:ABC-type transporter Mla subunit MlaD